MKNKSRIQALIAVMLVAVSTLNAAGPEITVYKTPTCGCCAKWVEHLKDNGFVVTVHEVSDTTPVRQKYGVPDSMRSCHTGIVNGYSIEGHVPVADIQKLLQTKPAGAKGIAVPGMPMGSPGMEGPRADPYSVYMFDAKGQTSIFQKYPLK